MRRILILGVLLLFSLPAHATDDCFNSFENGSAKANQGDKLLREAWDLYKSINKSIKDNTNSKCSVISKIVNASKSAFYSFTSCRSEYYLASKMYCSGENLEISKENYNYCREKASKISSYVTSTVRIANEGGCNIDLPIMMDLGD